MALLAVNNPIAVIFTGCFMSILDIAGLQITNLTVYNEYTKARKAELRTLLKTVT